MKYRGCSPRWYVYLAFFVTAVMLMGCSPSGSDAFGLQLGVAIPESEPVASLAAVMENPSEYNGKTIVMKGIVSGQCSALCEFFFRDGVHTATIYPEGFKFPKLELNKPVTLYTQVISGEGQTVFSALGLKME